MLEYAEYKERFMTKKFQIAFILTAFAAISLWCFAASTFSEDASVTLSKSASSGVSTAKYPVEGYVDVGDSTLRLREWVWGRVIANYTTGARVTVIGEEGDFYKVQINGVKGYMHKNYVSTPNRRAPCVEPYYPGNTKSGGYIPRGSSGSSSYASGSSAAESGALASYRGGKLPPAQFVALFGPVAQASMRNTGVPASVTLAQAILETGWGSSSIGDAKNLFGIKGTGPAGTTRVSTKEYYNGSYVTTKAGFRKYHTWQESIDDHARLLQNSRYAPALERYKADKNADAYARGIHKAGYATDPTYADKLISLMNSYNLKKWDI